MGITIKGIKECIIGHNWRFIEEGNIADILYPDRIYFGELFIPCINIV